MKQLLNSALVSSDDTQPHSIIAKCRFLNKNKQTNQTNVNISLHENSS